MKRRNLTGMTLVEMLVAMGVLGLVLGIVNAFFISNNNLASQQMTSADVNLALKQSILRMSEIISQANYIYPAERTMTMATGKSFKTGSNALAVLVPENTPYCPMDSDNVREYCGFMYVLEPRANHVGVLGTRPGTTNTVLVEYRTNATINWTIGTIPATTVVNWSAMAPVAGVVVDSVNAAETQLGRADNLVLVDKTKKSVDEQGRATDLFSYSINTNDAATALAGSPSASNALIQSVTYTIGLSYTRQGKTISMEQTGNTMARAIPRGGLPILTNN
jgi:prepilin-type N-terminal cleavage/methylation domain-containing protein